MPSNGHPQPPDDHPRCDCGGCREFQAIHDGHCAELPRAERQAKRTTDRDAQRRYEDAVAEQAPMLPWAV